MENYLYNSQKLILIINVYIICMRDINEYKYIIIYQYIINI